MTLAAERSYEPIIHEDLTRLAEIARSDRENLFARRPLLADRYRDRLLCVGLCQGAALHYIDGTTGVKDFDVWSFFAGHEAGPFPARRRVERDFGDSKFGRMPADTRPFIGRRVDLIGRSIPALVGSDPVAAIRTYLEESRTRSAQELGRKALVLVDPEPFRGTIAWPVGATRSAQKSANPH